MRGHVGRLVSRWSVDGAASVRPLDDRRVGRLGQRWSRLAPYLGPSAAATAALSFVSLAGGFSEASLIFLLVRIASTLADVDSTLELSVGPLDARMDLDQTFVAASIALALTFALNLIAAVLIARLSVTFLNRTRKRAMGAFLEADWAAQSRERAGRLQELLSAHVNKISQAVYSITSGINAALSFLALLLSAVIIQPIAAGLLLVAVVLLGLALLPLGRLTKRRSARQVAGNTRYALAVAETVSMTREINAFGVWREVRASLAAIADRAARQSFLTRVLVRGNPIVYQSAVMALLLAGMAGVHFARAGDVTGLGAVVILLVRAMAYSQQINSAFQQANEIAPYVDALEDQVASYTLARRKSGARPLERVDVCAFESVSFGYEPGRDVLSEVSLELRRGEVLGIVGPSGSGKSTLLQLILRLRHPTDGRYVVNGLPASEFDAAAWTRRFALVPQENHLLRGSVHDNIAMLRDDLSVPTLERAALQAHLHDEIVQLTNGYQTEIGSGAADLSGGQRQRLGLARALAGSPDVLVLDEPTSALDMHSETLVQQTLHDLRGSLSMVIVAHRLSTLSLCDNIAVLEDGRVTALGTFGALQRESSFFRDAVALSRLPS